MTKNGYYGNGRLNLAWDLGVSFLDIPNWVIGRVFLKHFFRSWSESVIEKCAVCFLVYLFLRVLFFCKKVLQDRNKFGIEILSETYPLVCCNTHHSQEALFTFT